MIITIKTTLIELTIDDSPTLDRAGYTKREVPELPTCIESAIDAAIKLHESVASKKVE